MGPDSTRASPLQVLFNLNNHITVNLVNRKNYTEWSYSARMAIGGAKCLGYIDGCINVLKLGQVDPNSAINDSLRCNSANSIPKPTIKGPIWSHMSSQFHLVQFLMIYHSPLQFSDPCPIWTPNNRLDLTQPLLSWGLSPILKSLCCIMEPFMNDPKDGEWESQSMLTTNWILNSSKILLHQASIIARQERNCWDSIFTAYAYKKIHARIYQLTGVLE